MPRKLIGDQPLTTAERQRRYREKKKKQGQRDRRIWVNVTDHKTEKPGKPILTGKPETKPMSAAELAELRESIKAELKKTWEPELKAEKLKAAKAEGRKLARQKDKAYENGRVDGICSCAAFFIGKDRRDIAQSLLAYYYIDRSRAEAALQDDKRTKSLTLATLDRGRAWDAPPSILK
jgi:hypothetical protein